MDVPPALASLLASQYGLATRTQSRKLGLGDGELRRLVRTGRWVRVAPSVYSVANHRDSWVRRLWAAHLHAGPGSLVSHESAGRLHGYQEVPAGLVTLIAGPVYRRPLDGVRLRVVTDLDPAHVTEWNGLPVTTPLRTVVDLASTLHIATLRLLVEHAVTDRRLSLAQLGAFHADLRRQGKNGVARLGQVLDDLGPGDGLPRSELERLLDRVIELSGVPSPVHEYPLPGRGAVSGFVDRCWPEARLIVEGDGRKWHTRRQQALRDATRSLEAQAVGYETTPLLWEHLANDPQTTAVLLRTVHDRRTALLDGSRAR
jgi:Transcriptional regulator, AbiEi antitoxin